ncbi:MAG: asparagine synthase (glutamine-hydrolyzing) [Bacteroidetes bacterium]|nr:asparagine synthase (glutamine-hydrolyzing) [Bacteroidota bacterium]
MCGFLFYQDSNGLKADRIIESVHALNLMNHRGPDSDGVVLINSSTGEHKTFRTKGTLQGLAVDIEDAAWFNSGDYDIFLGHKRLSIIEPNITGHQPMTDGNGNWILFNGEVYNYIEIREALKRDGIYCITNTDTEVLLRAYLHWGSDAVSTFNGMFSIVIWDNAARSIFVVNDRYGVKPLYWRQTETSVVFSSEIKPILHLHKGRNTFDQESVSRFEAGGITVADERTFFAETKRFYPAHFCSLQVGRSRVTEQVANAWKPFYKLPVDIQTRKSDDAVYEEYHHLLSDAVRLRLRSDVPLGISLSGGLDSSAAYVLMRRILGREHTIAAFSAVHPGKAEDESEFIDELGKDGLLKLHKVDPTRWFSPADYKEHIRFQETPLPRLTYYSQWCVSRLTRQEGFVVLLCGQGADESVAGYHHHFYRYARNLIVRGRIQEYLSQVKSWAAMKNLTANQVHHTVLNEWKLVWLLRLGLKKLGTKLEEKWYSAGSLTEILKMDLEEFQLPHFLHADDRNGMAFSIETRHPFMDYRLIDFSFSLPDRMKIHEGWQKWVLRQSVSELPDKIRWRKDKKGFATPENQYYSILDPAIQSREQFRKKNVDWFCDLYGSYM